MTALLSFTVDIVSFGPCYKCSVPITGPRARHDKCKEHGTRETFFCINGHEQCFGASEMAKLRTQLERETKRREWAEQSTKTARHAEAIARGKLKAQSERVKNGVCPCCKRSFQNLKRHMSTKHPEFCVDTKEGGK